MRLQFLFLCIVFSNLSFSQLLIKNTTIIDVVNKKLLPSQQVLIDNGKIISVGKNVKTLPNVQVIDGSGKYLMPGLVDAHVHFFQSGGIYTRPDAMDLRKYKSYDEEIKWLHENMGATLQRYLSAGITSVIDVGSNIRFLQQRDSFRNKTNVPAIYITGPLLTTWQADIFRDLKDDEPFYEMKTEDDARTYVKQQLPFQPDFIKIWFIVEGKNKDSSARASLHMIKAAIDEAHKNGLKVAVHATERITAKLSVESGADFLVHSVDDEPLDDAFVQLLKNRKTVLSPTLVVVGNYHKVFGQEYKITEYDYKYGSAKQLNSIIDLKSIPDTNFTNNYKNYVRRARNQRSAEDELMRANLKKLVDGGVTIATGTDAGNIGTLHVSSYFDELREMKKAGLNNWQLLQASTINGAKAVGKDSEFGSVTNGKRADLLLLNKNPLDDIMNVNSIYRVINKGILFNPDSIFSSSPEELADQQLLAYNAHNLEAFLAPYADDVEVYRFPNKLMAKGKDAMRKMYEFVNTTPQLYCRLMNRIVQGNIVVDHEEVWGFGDKPFYGLAIYEVKDGRIQKVYFPQ